MTVDELRRELKGIEAELDLLSDDTKERNRQGIRLHTKLEQVLGEASTLSDEDEKAEMKAAIDAITDRLLVEVFRLPPSLAALVDEDD